MGMPTFSPVGATCAACGQAIPHREGRRYRMKWRHERCLPGTRQAVVKMRTTEDDSLERSAGSGREGTESPVASPGEASANDPETNLDGERRE